MKTLHLEHNMYPTCKFALVRILNLCFIKCISIYKKLWELDQGYLMAWKILVTLFCFLPLLNWRQLHVTFSWIWMINSRDISYSLFMINFDNVINSNHSSSPRIRQACGPTRNWMTIKREKGWLEGEGLRMRQYFED